MASEWVCLTSQESEQIYVNLANASSMHRDANLTCIWFHAEAGESGKIRVTETIDQILASLAQLRRADKPEGLVSDQAPDPSSHAPERASHIPQPSHPAA